MCWKRMLLGFDKKPNAWKTSKGLTHMRDVHHPDAKASANAKAAQVSL